MVTAGDHCSDTQSIEIEMHIFCERVLQTLNGAGETDVMGILKFGADRLLYALHFSVKIYQQFPDMMWVFVFLEDTNCLTNSFIT